jgi:hypothetical protein
MKPERRVQHILAQHSAPGTDASPEPDDLDYALNHLIEAEQHLRHAHQFLKAELLLPTTPRVAAEARPLTAG